MAFAAAEAISAFRKDPFQYVLGVIGFDLTGVDMKFCVRDRPDMPGDPRLLLATTGTPGADGCRFVSVEVDEDGVPTSLIEIVASKAQMATLPQALMPGDTVKLAYDFQWTLAPDGSGLSALEETILFGDFNVMGSVNG